MTVPTNTNDIVRSWWVPKLYWKFQAVPAYTLYNQISTLSSFILAASSLTVAQYARR
jgi:hypothetical protein